MYSSLFTITNARLFAKILRNIHVSEILTIQLTHSEKEQPTCQIHDIFIQQKNATLKWQLLDNYKIITTHLNGK